MTNFRIATRLVITLVVSMVGAACAVIPEKKLITSKFAVIHDQATTLYNAGNIHRALKIYYKSLEFAEITGDNKTIKETLLNIGSIHVLLNEFKAATTAFKRVLAISDSNTDFYDLHAKIGIASILTREHKPDAALEMYADVLQSIRGREPPLLLLEITVLNGMAVAGKKLGKLEVALNHLDNAEALAKQSGKHNQLAATLHNKASIFFSHGQYTNALHHAQQALELDQQAEHLSGITADLLMLAQINEKMGNPLRAYNNYLLADSIFKIRGIKKGREYCQAATKRLANNNSIKK